MKSTSRPNKKYADIPGQDSLADVNHTRLNIAFRSLVTLLLICFSITFLFAQSKDGYVNFSHSGECFALVNKNSVAQMVVSDKDYPGVMHITDLFREDIYRVSGKKPEIFNDIVPASKEIVLIGTLGKNPLIDKLVSENKIDVSGIKGKWETFQIEVIDNPFEEVEKALVIVGSDKRGTIFGMFDISESIGVSPWYWWADVPVKKHEEIFIKSGKHTKGSPKVKYRGIFINDEAPALAGWVEENYGGFNHKFYEKVFELILRLKGNYLWPAMWGRAIYDDDTLSAPLADKMGVVIGTSHHEPLMRAHVEWSRYGTGPWNYEKNSAELNKFWREGMERMGNNESVVTIGMRGDGDEAMTEGTAIELLENIVKEQRQIIEEVTGKPASETPQAWALYKEVQDYYDKGMRVPDDVTLLLCDDNWGNIRILPPKDERDHPGGYGIYYHYDFVGGPVSYKWLNVTQIERVWEQMHLAYKYNANRLWLVNVGDIKPMEFPISFFLDYAWNPDAWPAEKLPEYYTLWASRQFGDKHAREIGEIIALYTKYNSRRTPEMLSPEIYSLNNYREAETVVSSYKALVEKSKLINKILNEEYRDAFYQLVLFPVTACANLNEMYFNLSKNKLYALQGRASTNYYAEKVEQLFNKDKALTEFYHKEMADGKWNHMMSQTHIGYTSWNQPDNNILPAVVKLNIRDIAALGIIIEGAIEETEKNSTVFSLPEFDRVNNQQYFIELFRKGQQKCNYSLQTEDTWIMLSSAEGELSEDTQIMVSIDWEKIPGNITEGKIIISGAGSEYIVSVPVKKKIRDDVKGFIENNGIVSMEAVNYTRKFNSGNAKWLEIPNLGRTNSSITPVPVMMDRQIVTEGSSRLEYDFYVFGEGKCEVIVYLSPTLNFLKSEGLKYAISIDNENPQLVNMHENEIIQDWKYPEWWNTSVSENIKKKISKHIISSPGQHTLKIWMVDPGVVIQKIVIDCGGLKESYLGPPESLYINDE